MECAGSLLLLELFLILGTRYILFKFSISCTDDFFFCDYFTDLCTFKLMP